ncbi:PhoX family protein [Acidocella facilis]|uniref:PhoX family protein n=1 Tax=Acidocella facilis TaxID=525 RepID=UPI001F1C9333|nr:alkaline phosphatase PhoX [Acidocella facilis]
MRRRTLLLSGIASLAAGGAGAQMAATPPYYLGYNPANPQAPGLGDKIGPGFSRLVIARWGDLLQPDAPPFTPDALSLAQADNQFPYDAVIAALIAPPPAQDNIPRLVLVTANPTAPANMLFPGGMDRPAIAGREQGVTVVNLQYQAGRWVTVVGGYQTRRLSDGTLCQLSGPAAAQVGSTVQGVLAVQAGSATPWGNVLLAEGDAGPWLNRLSGLGFGYGDPGQGARYGWVVELDALNPLYIPVKRTAIGRIARAGLLATQSKDGRPVLFFTQDAQAGMLFRFVAATNAQDGTALDSGTLSVAVLGGDGIDWVALPNDVPTLAGLANAGATAGGETFDAPAGLALSQDGGALYMACAGNAQRSVADSLNPGGGEGHILRFTLPGGDATARHFPATLALVAGNPALREGTQYGPGSQAWLRKPRTLAVDPAGNLWIGTDQKGDTEQSADGLFIMQTSGPAAGALAYAYLAPVGAAAGGVAFDANSKTAFGAVRHPGATPGASFDHPETRWPTLRPNMPPQTTIIGLVTQ